MTHLKESFWSRFPKKERSSDMAGDSVTAYLGSWGVWNSVTAYLFKSLLGNWGQCVQ